MKKTGIFPSVCILFAISLFSIGCGGGSSDQPDLGSVTGAIALDGKPLGGVIVVFSPEEGRQSVGITDADGKYELQYTGDSRGAKIGKHSVGFMASDDEDVKASASIPAKYAAGTETGLSAEVVAGKNTFDFTDLTSD
ncbi:MAG: hypothetical protein JKY95_17105 [Planctomycetaceae bacterium]|nr:hypothetical protein [Planctomycetaceae bacterium]